LLLDLQQKLSTQVSVFTGLYPLWGADEVSGEVVIGKSLSYMLLWMVPNTCETGTVVHTALGFYFGFCFLVLCYLSCLPFFRILSVLLRSAGLALIFLNCENGDMVRSPCPSMFCHWAMKLNVFLAFWVHNKWLMKWFYLLQYVQTKS
jgi:hypothetical protein